MSHAGRFIWRELVSTDLDAASNFYSSLFGWSAAAMEMPTGPYTIFKRAEEDVGGMMGPNTPEEPSHWVDYITVDDVDASLVKVVELGGTAITAAMDIPVGRFALVADPAGAMFALFRGAPGATDTERRPPAHTFCWSQLMTRELDTVVPFYTGLFGWEVSPMGPGAVMFSRGDKPVASARSLPADAPAANHWLPYVAVDDCDASVEEAKRLGANIFHEPTTMPGMGRFAVLSDPARGVFALWKDLSQGA